MSSGSGSTPPEIVIVRRKQADDLAGGKGGSWKIAYADFVTAMMAFFLVMWLINASNEEVRTEVANYFNPIKLTDTSTGAKSLMDTSEVQEKEKKGTGKTGREPTSAGGSATNSDVLSDPPRALEKIAGQSGAGSDTGANRGDTADPTPSKRADKGNPGIGDPFDPMSWAKEAVPQQPVASPEMATDNTGSSAASLAQDSSTQQDATAPGKAGSSPEKKALEQSQLNGQQEKLARQMLDNISASLGRSGSQLAGTLAVRATSDGVVISLTESEKFEMFKAGSAEPEPEAIKLAAAIAGELKKVSGGIYIRGHTDARPFRNGFYDNWQLSTARAHVAHYMLLRGGLDENRVFRVEGVADREPLNSEDRLAAENRRIEFFIQMKKP
jgi:chemotaxis protein MotB